MKTGGKAGNQLLPTKSVGFDLMNYPAASGRGIKNHRTTVVALDGVGYNPFDALVSGHTGE